MKRTQIYLTIIQMKILKQKALDKDISLSELIRRILDNYIDNNDKQKEAALQ